MDRTSNYKDVIEMKGIANSLIEPLSVVDLTTQDLLSLLIATRIAEN